MRLALCLFLPAALAFAEDPAVKVPEKDAKPIADRVTAALKGKEEEAKKSAIAAAGETPNPLVADALAAAFNDPSEDVRIAAANALGKMTGLAEAAKVLSAAFTAHVKVPKILHAITPAIAAVGHIGALGVLKEYLLKRIPERDDAENLEIGDALMAVGALRCKASVELLFDLMKKESSVGAMKKPFQQATEGTTMRAMNALAGKEFKTVQEAQAWWKGAEKALNDDLTPKK